MASKLDKYGDDIFAAIDDGYSQTSIAKDLNVARSTLQNWLRMNAAPVAEPTAQDSWNKVLIVPDTHAPFEDKAAWSLAMQIGEALKPDTIVHMGDLADFYAVSSHVRDPKRKLTLVDEIEHAKTLRDELDSLGARDKRFIMGNHEFRLERYIRDKAPELDGAVKTADEFLELSDNGWKVTPYMDYDQIGKLHLTHDTGQGGKYTAARAVETFNASVVIGHHHALQYFVVGDARGDHKLGCSFGWLGDFEAADYMHRIKQKVAWTHGIGIAYVDPATELAYVQPVPFVDNTAMLNGTLYRA